MTVILYLLCRNLPAKPEEEAQKHRQEYEEMVAQAKKRGDFLFMHVFVVYVSAGSTVNMHATTHLEVKIFGECIGIIISTIMIKKILFHGW